LYFLQHVLPLNYLNCVTASEEESYIIEDRTKIWGGG